MLLSLMCVGAMVTGQRDFTIFLEVAPGATFAGSGGLRRPVTTFPPIAFMAAAGVGDAWK